MTHATDDDVIEKTRNTARFFTENGPISWTLLVFTVLWGVYGYATMPKRKDPEVPVRVAAALLSWPGATAANMEERVTRVVERKLSENSHIERIESTSRAGVGVVTIMLDESIEDTAEEFDDVWLKLQSMGGLPEGASVEFLKDFGDTSALMLTVASPRASEAEVTLRARDVQRALENARTGLDATGRTALVACFPQALDPREFVAVGRDFAAWFERHGAADVRVFSGPGFLGLDSRSALSEQALIEAAQAFASERLRDAELHPDVWRFAAIRNAADTREHLAAVAGEKYSYSELDDYSEQLERALQSVPEVARVTRVGGVGDVIYLEYSQERLASYGMGPNQVAQAIAARNITGRGGAVEVQGKTVLIAPDGELLSERDVGEIVVGKSRSGAPVHVRDVANVTRAYDTPRYVSYSTWRDARGAFQRTRAITLSVTMKSGLQIADFGAAVEAKLARVRQLVPEDLRIERVSDQPEQVRENVDLFMSSLYEAIALVVVVALVGFWEWRSALLMALSIPITLAMTFGLMRLLGLDVQQISIGSLIIALGLLVDDPVVAGDAIKRELDKGLPARIAAWLGPTKLATAILFATGTNVMAYLPFLALGGDSGRFIYSLPVVLTVSLVASRLVSMSFIPLLGMVLLRRTKRAEPTLEERKRRGFARFYAQLVEGAVARRWLVLTGALLAFAGGAMGVASRLEQSFFPKDYSYLSYVDVWLPEDAPLAATRVAAEQVEAIIREVAGPKGLHTVTTFAGGGGPRFWFSISPEQRQSNYAQLIVRMADKRQTDAMVGPLQDALSARIAGARVDVKQIESGPAVGTPIAIRLSGESTATLRELSAKLEGVLRRQPNAERVRNNWGSDHFSVKLKVDTVRASAADVTNHDVASSSALALNGARVGLLQEGDRQLPITMRLRASERQQLSDVENLYVFAADPRQKTPLRHIAAFDFASDAGKIARRNHARTITVTAFPVRGALASEVMTQIMPELTRLERELPPGYALEIGGEHHEATKSFGELSLVLLMSVLGIFAMLVWQFKSAIKPLIVFAAIPFGVIAALLSLLAMDTPFGYMAFLGVISLIGVIVSHVIVLFDFIEERREAGAPLVTALTDAGILRLRPVLVTVGATVLGLIPLAAHGGPLWEPLCWVQIGGLTFATVVTLVLVPVLYAIFVLDLKVVTWSAPLAPECDGLAMRRFGPVCGALMLLAWSSTGHAQEIPAAALTGRPNGLVADEVARRAVGTSLDALQKYHEVEAARAQLGKALIDYAPRLSGTASYTRYQHVEQPSLGNLVVAPGAPAGPLPAGQPLVAGPVHVEMLDHAVSLVGALNVPLTDYAFRLVQSHEAAAHQLASAEAAHEAARRKAAYDGRALYYQWVQAELDAEVARQDFELGRENLVHVEALALAGSASAADVARAQSSVAGSELVLVQARNLAALLRERCRIAMHDEGTRVYEIGEDFRDSPAQAPDLDLAALIRTAQSQRAEVRALGAQARTYDAYAKVARAQGLPRIDLNGQLIVANPNPRYFPQQDEFRHTWQVGGQLTLSPNDVFLGRKVAASHRARAAQLDAQRRSMLDAVRTEVVEAVLSHVSAVAAVDTTRRRLVAAETSYRSRRERYVNGKATFVELAEAQTELLRARLDVVQAQVGIRLARSRLAYVTGAPT